MGILSNVGQKLKGKGQKYKGDLQVRYGHTIRGNTNRLKGTLNEFVADTKLQRRRARRNTF